MRGWGRAGCSTSVCRLGPHGSGFRPFGGGLSLRKLELAPHGIDLGPLEQCLPERLRTDDRRIELAPSLFVEDVERLRSRLQASKADERLLLIGRRHLRSNNSWMHNFPRLMGGSERCTLLMHPDDAKRSGLVNGERVVVTSRTGSVEVGSRGDGRGGAGCGQPAARMGPPAAGDPPWRSTRPPRRERQRPHRRSGG